MTDYINAFVPVSNGDDNGNYPWMQIRAAGTQTTASRFGEIQMSSNGQLSGKMFYYRIHSDRSNKCY